jgi:hypothetical protein
MTDAQFVAIAVELQQNTKLQQANKELLTQIEKNTQPPGKGKWWFERIEFAAAVGGIFSYLIPVIQWLWRQYAS